MNYEMCYNRATFHKSKIQSGQKHSSYTIKLYQVQPLGAQVLYILIIMDRMSPGNVHILRLSHFCVVAKWWTMAQTSIIILNNLVSQG